MAGMPAQVTAAPSAAKARNNVRWRLRVPWSAVGEAIEIIEKKEGRTCPS